MTNKQKYLRVIRKLMKERYEKKQSFDCPLCTISDSTTCQSCPNIIFETIGNKSIPCENAKTFEYNDEDQGIKSPRYLFWKEAYPILEKLPNKAFTEKGFDHKYFKTTYRN